MKKIIHKLSSVNRNIYVIAFFILIDIFFFWKYFLLGLIPIPADVIIGGYYPWLNEKWGYAVGVPVKNALMSDVVSLLYPWRFLAINYMKSGQLPLWDHTSFLGTSLIGNFQAGIFNPFNLLYFLPFGFNQIWGFQVVIQPLLAMVCMYYLLKNWKLDKISSAFGAVTYAFSAQLLVWIEYNVHSFIISVFPLFILLLDRFIQTKKTLYLALVSLVIGYIIFIGYPQHLYYFTFFGLIYILFFSFRGKEYLEAVLSGVKFLVSVALGLCLSAVSLLPGIESLNLSIKSLDRVAEGNAVLFLNWSNLITAFIPDFFGNPATNNYFGAGYYESLIFYTSIVALPFAFAAFSSVFKERRTAVLLVFLIFTFGLALQTPLSAALQQFPVLGLKGSVSSRVLFIYGFSVSALAAIGLNKFLKDGFSNTRPYLKYLPILAVAGAGLGLAFNLLIIKASLGNLELIPKDFERMLISSRNIVIPLMLAAAVSAVILVSRFPRIKKLLIPVLFLLLLFDSYKFSSKYLPFTESKLIFPETGTLSFLKNEEEPFRIAIQKAELLPANTWSVYGLESASGYNILLPRSTADYLHYLNSSKIPEGYSRVIDLENPNSKLLDAANVKYLVILLRKDGSPDSAGGPPYDLDLKKYKQVSKEGAVAVYENTDFIPRFHTVKSLIPAKSNLETYSLMSSAEFNSQEKSFVEGIAETKQKTDCLISNIKYSPQSVLLETDCAGEAFLSLSQLFYPGWKANINGESRELIRTNGIFSGINLPGGKSEIEVTFFPDSFKYGFIISLTTALILGFFIIFSLRKSIKI